MIGAIVLWLAAIVPQLAVPNGIIGSIAVVTLALAFIKSTRAPTLAAVHRSVGYSLGVGALAGIVAQFGVSPAADWLGSVVTGSEPDLSSLKNVQGNLANYLSLLALGILFGGVIEEIVNRGFLIGWGTSRFGEAWAIPLTLLSSFAFGVAHMWQGPAGMITTGLMGLTYGLVYVFCGRKLLPAMMAHATSNFCGISLIYFNGV